MYAGFAIDFGRNRSCIHLCKPRINLHLQKCPKQWPKIPNRQYRQYRVHCFGRFGGPGLRKQTRPSLKVLLTLGCTGVQHTYGCTRFLDTGSVDCMHIKLLRFQVGDFLPRASCRHLQAPTGQDIRQFPTASKSHQLRNVL